MTDYYERGQLELFGEEEMCYGVGRGGASGAAPRAARNLEKVVGVEFDDDDLDVCTCREAAAPKRSPNYDPSCPHCRNYNDGGGCAFHEARGAHDAGRCRPEDHCFFCFP